jgi:hypothetical protein
MHSFQYFYQKVWHITREAHHRSGVGLSSQAIEWTRRGVMTNCEQTVIQKALIERLEAFMHLTAGG